MVEKKSNQRNSQSLHPYHDKKQKVLNHQLHSNQNKNTKHFGDDGEVLVVDDCFEAVEGYASGAFGTGNAAGST